ncbi:MAG: hypothetical protein ACLFWL_03525 [Candidatus Brocadiia bacterium]
MLDLWLKIIGKSDTRIPDGANVRFVLKHAPKSWMVFVLVAVLLALLYGVWRLYRNENNTCPEKWKTVLATLRICVLLLAAFIFLGPVLTYSTEKTVEPYIMVMLDDSLSMAIKDHYTDKKRLAMIAEAIEADEKELESTPPSRSEIVDRLLRHENHRFIRELATHGNVRVMTFSDKLRLRETFGAERPEDVIEELGADKSDVAVGAPIPPLSPEGKTTNIARAIREARRLAAGRPLAGIVLLSDGQHTAGGDPGAAASRAAEQKCPIFTVGFGDPSEPINLRIADLWAPENVFARDPMLLQTTVQSQGIETGSAVLEMRVKNADQEPNEPEDRGTLVDTKNIPLKSGMQTISLKHTPTKPGTFIYSVSVSKQPKELLESDNFASAAVNVLEEKVRILLVSGSPSWEYRLVKNLLTRDKTIDLSCWLQTMSADMEQGGNTPIQRLPRNREELLKYDALLMFDPDPAEFNEKWIEEIKNFMENHAGGFLWMSGPQNSLQFLTHSRTRDIRDILPVRLQGLEAGILEAMGTTRQREWPLKIRPEGTDHPILQIKDDPAIVKRVWERLPGVYWAFPAKSPKPGSQVLVEHTNPRLRTDEGPVPLLVTGQYGPGHSVYLGFQSTWRWRKTGLVYFQKFWIQTVRYLVQGRLVRGRTRGRLLTNRDVYAVGDRISITAKLFDSSYDLLTRQIVEARLKAPHQPAQKLQLRSLSGKKGHYQASAIARHMGMNKLEIALQKPDGSPISITRQFTVEMPNVESADPRMNKTLLKEIAHRSGGKYFALNAMVNIADAIPNRQRITTVHGRPIPLWDTSRVLILFVVLLTLEWSLRKKFRLL